MKQVQLTDTLRSRLTAAGADPTKVVVFETVALNQLPIRKNHPLYKGAIHSRPMLQEMADALNKESLPLQVQHDGSTLPFGRAFYGEVLDSNQGGGSELRVLFWVDGTHPDMINQINAGTIDQVSVSVLPADASCSQCNYNFFAEDASIENIWSATCPDNHTMGMNGARLNINKLASWFELSLVGKGGTTGARISGPAETRLAADGSVTHPFALSLTFEQPKPERKNMSEIDVNKLIADLSDARGNLLVANADKGRAEASVASLNAQITELTAQVNSKNAEIEALKAAAPEKGEVEFTALQTVAKHILTLAGRVTDEVPAEVDAIVELVKGLKLNVSGTGSQAAHLDASASSSSASAFKSRR